MTTKEMSGVAESIRRHATVFDTLTQAVIGTTLEGEIVYWSHTAERMYGWTPADVLGRPIVEVTPAAASRTRAEEIMERLGRGASWSGEFLVCSRSGEEFVVHVTDVPVKDGAGALVGVVGISFRREE